MNSIFVQSTSVFRTLLNRSLVIYLVALSVFCMTVNFNLTRLKILNYLETPLDYLFLFSEGKEPFDQHKFHAYLDYYENLAAYIPDLAEAHGLLGFCYYHLGQKNQAIRAYQKAIESKSDFFWFHYNLGIIYFKEKNYKLAAESFKKAMVLNPKDTVVLMMNSKVYSGIGGKNRFILDKDFTFSNILEEIDKRIRSAYESCYLLLTLSYYHLEDYRNLKQSAMNFFSLKTQQKALYAYLTGLANYQLKDYKTAVSYLNESIKLNPHYADAYQYLGLSLQKLNQKDLALVMMSRFNEFSSSQNQLDILQFEKNINLRIY